MADVRRIVTLADPGTYVTGEVNYATNPSFEIDTSGWAATNSSGAAVASAISRVTSWADSGSASLRLTGTNAADTTTRSFRAQTGSGLLGMPVNAKASYFAAAEAKVVDPAALGVRMTLAWFNSNGDPSAVPTTSGNLALPGAMGSARVTLIAAAPADAAFAQIRLEAVTNAPNDTIDVQFDSVILAKAGAAVSYFDGDTLDHAWIGAPNASESWRPVSLVKDLEVDGTYSAVRGSFQLKAAERHTVMAASTRRYEGARAVAESHDNAQVTWKALVRGSTADEVITNLEAMLGCTENPTGLYFEWRPDGATQSTYREIRAPATYQLTYDWAQYVGALSMYVDITLPVEPLGRGIMIAQAIPDGAPVRNVSMASPIGGNAPALADIDISGISGAAGAAAFALIGWTPRPATSTLSVPAPFGLIEGESATGNTNWPVTGVSGWSGGNGLLNTFYTNVKAFWQLDSSVMHADEFDGEEIDIEFWAKVRLAAGLGTTTAKLYMGGNGVANGLRYAIEYGSAGKTLTLPSSGTADRIIRLGTIKLPVKQEVPVEQDVWLEINATNSGTIGLDWLLAVPAKSRALSPSGEPNDSSYPSFGAGFGVTKRIRSDLSGFTLITASGKGAPDAGLGGSLIQIPPGDVDLVMLLSNVVPDDPISNTSSYSMAGTYGGKIWVTPRYWGAAA